VTSIGISAFNNCSNLIDIILDSNEIVSRSYSSSSNLNNIFGKQVRRYVIGGSATSIGDFAFCGADSLTSISIGNSVKVIGAKSFENCYKLEQVSFGNSLMEIGDYAFHKCNNLTKVKIPENVIQIGDCAFTSCPSMTELTIPKSVSNIGLYAFYGCTALKKVIVERTNPSAYNCDIDAFGESSSALSNINLIIPKDSKNEYTVTAPWCYFKLLERGVTGDLNMDGEVNGADIVTIINCVMDDSIAEGDVNGDGEVNGGDIVAIINYVLIYTENAVRQQASCAHRAQLKSADNRDYLYADTDACGIVIGLTNQRDFTAFQFMLNLPDGCELTNIVADASRLNSHVLQCHRISDGKYFILSYNLSNKCIVGQDGALLNLQITGNMQGEMTISDVCFFTPQAQTNHLAGLQIDTATGLASLEDTMESVEGNIYDIQGRLVITAEQYIRQNKTLPAGLYIRNGRKFMIK
jgi:hypothetical protein